MAKSLAIAASLALAAAGSVPAMSAASADGGSSPTGATAVKYGTFSGTVKSPSGAGVKGIYLSLAKGYNNEVGGWSRSQAKGRFSNAYVSQKLTGKVSVNRFSGESKYIGGYWAGNGKKIVSSISKGKTLTLAPGKKVTGITPVLTTCATVSGTVKGATKSSRVMVFNDKDKRLVTRTDNVLGKGGKYNVRGLTTGKYYLVASSYSARGGAGQDIESYYGTKSGKMPSKPNLVISSCKDFKKVDFKVRKHVEATSAPRIIGSAKAGATLTAVKGGLKPSTVKLSYRWYRNGRAIAGATGKTYKVQPADLGNSIAVTITAKKTGYLSVVTKATRYLG